MEGNKKIKKFDSSDIEKYHKGLLSPVERNAIEKAALDDPFLADALEGYNSTGVDIQLDLAELKNRLDKRIGANNPAPLTRSVPWLRIAAMMVIIAGAALLVYYTGFRKESSPIALQKEQGNATKEEGSAAAPTDTPRISSSGSTSVLKRKDQEFVNTPSSKTPAFKPITSDSISVLGNTLNGDIELQKKTVPPFTSTQEAAGVAARTEPVPMVKTPENLSKEEEKITQNADKFKEITDRPSFATEKNPGIVEEGKVVRAKAASDDQSQKNNLAARFNIFQGFITDMNNNPLPFANVTNVEDNVGTYADAKGYFNLTSPDTTLRVQVRSLGFNNASVELRHNVSRNQVVLAEDKSIDEFVVSNKKPNSKSRARDANMKLESEPEPEDGWENYDSYLANNLIVPDNFKIKQPGTEEVQLSFEINKLGQPVNIKVEKSLCQSCDQEAIRLIKQGPKWKRKNSKGRAKVRVTF